MNTGERESDIAQRLTRRRFIHLGSRAAGMASLLFLGASKLDAYGAALSSTQNTILSRDTTDGRSSSGPSRVKGYLNISIQLDGSER